MLKVGVELDIVHAESVGGHKLKLSFSDGQETVVDFAPFLSASVDPDTRRFLDSEAFGTYRIEWGNLVWGNCEMCFPIEDLYVGSLSEKPHLAVAEDRSAYGETDRDH